MKQLKQAIDVMPEQTGKPKNKLANIKINILPDQMADASYLDQEDFKDRKVEYERGGFGFVGVQAEAEIQVPFGAQWSDNKWTIHHISSPGLWGIESDMDNEYLEEVAREEVDQLKDQLEALNVDISNFDELAEQAIADL